MRILRVFTFESTKRKYLYHLVFVAAFASRFALPASVRASEPVDDFFAGLHAVAAGQFEQANALFDKATTANPGNADWQLNRAVSLMLSGHDQDAQAAFAVAAKLDPQNDDVSVWQIAQAGMFGRKLPPLELPGGIRLPTTGPMETLFDTSLPAIRLPTSTVPYSNKLLIAIMGLRSSNADEHAKAHAAIEDIARQFAKDQSTGFDAAKALYASGRYRQALGLLEPLAANNRGNGAILAHIGHSKLALGDNSGARAAYTQALQLLPNNAGCFIGRARSEIAVGSLLAAESDLVLAHRINDTNATALLAEADHFLTEAKSHTATPSEQLIRQEQFERELCRIELDIRDHPNDVDSDLALVRFDLRPRADGDVTIDGRTTRAIVPCGSMNVAGAADALAQAVKLAPDRPDVLLQEAEVAWVQNRQDEAITFARQAMSKGAIDLEMAVAWMRYNSALAKEKSAEAYNLANPPAGVWSWKPAGTTYIHVYSGRSPDFPGADALNRQAKELRDQAMRGFDLLQKQTAGSTVPRDEANAHMADAYHAFWNGNLDASIASAEQAIAIDPYNEHVLRFLVITCGKANSPKAQRYKLILDEVEK